jgi:predicted dehydrogenase
LYRTLEMGGYPDAFYGPTPWRHRVLGTKGEVRVVSGNHGEPDIVLYNEEHPDGKLFEHPVEKVHHGLLLEDFARTILHGETRGVRAADSLGESLTAMAIYRANDSGQWEDVFSEAFTTAAGAEAAQTVAARL